MELKSFNEKELNDIKKSWIDSLSGGHEVYEAEYSQLFDIIITGRSWGELDDRFNAPIYYGIFDEDKVLAIVLIVQSKKGSSTWIKLMDIYICPEIDIHSDTEDNTKKRLDIFTTSLIGIFSLTENTKRVDTLKIYGRTDALIAFLRGMHDVFSTFGMIQGVTVSIEGKWLVFCATK